MPSPGDPSGAAARRVGVLNRVVQLGRRRRAAEEADAQPPSEGPEQRIQALEQRLERLEALLEGLQDAVHRQSIRERARIDALEKKIEPAEIARALSRDARERGL